MLRKPFLCRQCNKRFTQRGFLETFATNAAKSGMLSLLKVLVFEINPMGSTTECTLAIVAENRMQEHADDEAYNCDQCSYNAHKQLS